VKVEFEVRDNYFRYIWTGGSYVKINAAGFLNQRQLEVTRATNGYALCVTQPVFVKTIPELEQLVATETNQWQLYQDIFDENTNLVFGAYTMLDQSIYAFNKTVNRKRIVASWDGRIHRYVNFTAERDTAWLRAVETPPVSDQLQAMITQVQQALPNILALTNQIVTVLDNTANATSNLNAAVVEARPALANFTVLSGQLREPGGLGVWALGTNGEQQVQNALTNANLILAHTDTNLEAILIHLSDITSNLNAQVRANTNLLGGISKAVTDADDLVQGLKRHWLLRSAFKTKATNAPAKK
jgi:hypothetical protein